MKIRISLVSNDILIRHKDQILQIEIRRFSEGTLILNRLESIVPSPRTTVHRITISNTPFSSLALTTSGLLLLEI